MSFRLSFTEMAAEQYHALQNSKHDAKRLRAVRKALAYLEANPRHPGLNTHKYASLKGPGDVEIFEAYAENQTPQAYRIFWHYGPAQGEITIIAITPHP